MGKRNIFPKSEHMDNVTVTQTPSHGLQLLQEKQVAAEHKHVRTGGGCFKC